MTRQEDGQDRPAGPRPFWSGVIAFGLVSLPVSLFPANRGKRLHLKMVDTDGTPLTRHYVCEKEDKPLRADQIVRGYEVEPGRFVPVEDEELEALAPEKSREIDLRRFVPLSDVDPMYFQRSYFLAPDGRSTKAYRLLARAMEAAERAAIATFVMRGKEYLVAILAEGGILRAETLRFHDELRPPEDIALPRRAETDPEAVKHMRRRIDKHKARALKSDWLVDSATERTLSYVHSKLERGEDVIAAPQTEDDAAEGDGEVIDLMQVLKRRLRGSTKAE